MPRGSLSPLFTWRGYVSSPRGPESSTTRHVLLALSLYMGEKGDGAFPSTRTLAADTGLSRRTVEKHLREAESQGWIGRDQHGFGGMGWKRYDYAASLPERLKGGEGGSPRFEKGGESDDKGGESDDNRVGKEVPMKSSVEDVKEGVSLHTGELFPEDGSNGDGSDPLENVVEAVWEKTLDAWRGRVGDRPGPDLKPTQARISKIRARARECLQAGMHPSETIRYLALAARGLYADDWSGRDQYLDPGKYAFRDDETVRKWVREGRKDEKGVSDADERFARRVLRIMEEDRRGDS